MFPLSCAHAQPLSQSQARVSVSRDLVYKELELLKIKLKK